MPGDFQNYLVEKSKLISGDPVLFQKTVDPNLVAEVVSFLTLLKDSYNISPNKTSWVFRAIDAVGSLEGASKASDQIYSFYLHQLFIIRFISRYFNFDIQDINCIKNKFKFIFAGDAKPSANNDIGKNFLLEMRTCATLNAAGYHAVMEASETDILVAVDSGRKYFLQCKRINSFFDSIDDIDKRVREKIREAYSQLKRNLNAFPDECYGIVVVSLEEVFTKQQTQFPEGYSETDVMLRVTQDIRELWQRIKNRLDFANTDKITSIIFEFAGNGWYWGEKNMYKPLPVNRLVFNKLNLSSLAYDAFLTEDFQSYNNWYANKGYYL